MADWLSALARLSASEAPCVLVTLAETRGSVPRPAGTKMVVTEDASFGTIGGGQLEYEALGIARALLAGGAVERQLHRFGLGPSLGQCCGGSARILFEPMSGQPEPWQTGLTELIERGEPAVLVSAIGAGARGKLVIGEESVLGAVGDQPRQAEAVALARALLRAPNPGVRFEEVAGGPALLFEPLRPDGLHVVLFGAGHVGKALVRILGELPCRVTWVDGRVEQFPREVPPNVTLECSEMPQHAVGRAPAGAAFLVMTHSHALDLKLCEQILGRDDFAYFGLIGSATKRTKFVKRFKARGLCDKMIARMVCPIGIPGLPGKHPGEIAVAVAAQLLMVRAEHAQSSGEVPAQVA